MINFEIKGGFLILASAFLLFGGCDVSLCALIAVLLHETAHIAASHLFGGQLKTVRFDFRGISMYAGFKGITGYFCDGFCAAAGPAVNLLTGIFASVFAATDLGYIFAGTNILLGLYNLIPATGLDGGVVLGSFLKELLPYETADWAMFAVSILSSLVLLGIGVWILLFAGNMTLVFCGLELGINAWKNRPGQLLFG